MADQPCAHSWQLTETGYTRQWATHIDEEAKTVTAYWGGSEDFSDMGAGDEHLECLGCGATMELPEGFEVNYE